MIIRRGEAERSGATPANVVEEAIVVPNPPLLDLPYNFAKAHGVVLRHENDGRMVVALREGADPLMLLEVRRYLAMPFDVEMADNATFDRYLSDHYAMDGSAAAMAGSIGTSDSDLLSDMLPSADDLLDSADDAPVIRLINGIIAEAVRQGTLAPYAVRPYEYGQLPVPFPTREAIRFMKLSSRLRR